MPTVHVAGDSHTLFCFTPEELVTLVGQPILAPCPVPPYQQQRTHHLGAITMHRVGRDPAVLESVVAETHHGDVLVPVFGEIDVRCHIVRLANAGRAVEEIVADLVTAYVARLAAIARSIVVFGVIPPFDPPGYNLEKFPIIGTLHERVHAARALNASLLRETSRQGLSYFDVYDELAGPDGSLPHASSDGFCHAGHHMKFVSVDKLHRLLTGQSGRI